LPYDAAASPSAPAGEAASALAMPDANGAPNTTTLAEVSRTKHGTTRREFRLALRMAIIAAIALPSCSLMERPLMRWRRPSLA